MFGDKGEAWGRGVVVGDAVFYPEVIGVEEDVVGYENSIGGGVGVGGGGVVELGDLVEGGLVSTIEGAEKAFLCDLGICTHF